MEPPHGFKETSIPSRVGAAPVALITGITGQDGSYLTELLLREGYQVHGLVRRSSSIGRRRLDRMFEDKSVYGKRLFLHYADLDDTTTIRRIAMKVQPTELYHLAGQSHVGASFDIPESTCQFTAMGTLKLLEIVRDLPSPPKFLHISSSEIFGRPNGLPQDEDTAMRPVTPYGAAKTFATNMTRLYRESFGVFAVNAICYNHESPRRGESFVTRKISKAAASIAAGRESVIRMGSLDASRDWGYAPEYVEGMWKMLQQEDADDYVLATGVEHTVEDFLRVAFDAVGLDWHSHYQPDERFVRPAEVTNLVGNPTKAATHLGWQAKTPFDDLVRLMVEHDQRMLQGVSSSQHLHES